MADGWVYLDLDPNIDTKYGPADEAELTAAWAEGKVSEETMVWKKGLPGWSRVGDLPDLKAAIAPVARAAEVDGNGADRLDVIGGEGKGEEEEGGGERRTASRVTGQKLPQVHAAIAVDPYNETGLDYVESWGRPDVLTALKDADATHWRRKREETRKANPGHNNRIVRSELSHYEQHYIGDGKNELALMLPQALVTVVSSLTEVAVSTEDLMGAYVRTVQEHATSSYRGRPGIPGLGGAGGRGGAAVGNIGQAPRNLHRATDSILVAASGAIRLRMERRDLQINGATMGGRAGGAGGGGRGSLSSAAMTSYMETKHAVEIEEIMEVARSLLCPSEGWKNCLISLVTQQQPGPLQYKFINILKSMGVSVDGDEKEMRATLRDEAEKMARFAGEIRFIAAELPFNIGQTSGSGNGSGSGSGSESGSGEGRASSMHIDVDPSLIFNNNSIISPCSGDGDDCCCDGHGNDYEDEVEVVGDSNHEGYDDEIHDEDSDVENDDDIGGYSIDEINHLNKYSKEV